MAVSRRHKKAFAALREAALAWPETREDHPWGESAIKVGTKVFVFLFLGTMKDGTNGLSISLKLPNTGAQALCLPFCAPTGYGLGASGWVSCRFSDADPVPVDILRPWIAESYRALAPSRLTKGLAPSGTVSTSAKKSSPKKTAAKKKTKKAPPKSASAKKTSAKKATPATKKTVTKKTAAKKTAAKKTAAKKTATKKTAAKKTSAKKTSAKKTPSKTAPSSRRQPRR